MNGKQVSHQDKHGEKRLVTLSEQTMQPLMRAMSLIVRELSGIRKVLESMKPRDVGSVAWRVGRPEEEKK